MEQKFQRGDMIRCQISTVKVIDWLAEGGQGDVYVVEQNGKKKALKWYKPSGMGKEPQKFYENLKKNCFHGSPDKKVFLWPEDVTEYQDGRFGYIMPLRPEGYYEIGDFLLTKVRFSSLQTVVDAALNIVNAYRLLHNEGYSYQDLNDGNFFINPQNGAVLICDNDNVAPDGENTGIAGKPGYIAPEIVLRKQMPDSYTDRFSMSIIIFMLFCLTRPMEGKRTFEEPRTISLMKRIYGSDPHFIMEDPYHPEYGADENVQKNAFSFWRALPDYMRALFMEALGQNAVQNPDARPPELKWVKNLVRFRSEIIKCKCGANLLVRDGQSTTCSKCGAVIRIPYKLKFDTDHYYIPGIPGTRIYRCQMGICNADEALQPVGRILANPSNPSIWGVQNLSKEQWDIETVGTNKKKVQPKGIISLKNNIRIKTKTETIIIEEA